MKVLVSFDGYFKESGVREYEGEPLEVMKKIASNHSYGQFDDLWFEEEGFNKDTITLEKMLEEIASTNGDGCDYITSIIEVTGEHKVLL